MEPETKTCQNCKQNFTVDAEDFGFYEKMQVPAPTWCPQCRMMRRMIFWNEHSFFKKKEERTGKEIFSMYPPESPVKIYERDFWWSDGWDPLSYGRDIDWSKPFLEQVYELDKDVPHPARSIINAVNSDYSNQAADLKNCYLVFNADASEDSLYCVGINKVKSCVDVFRSDNCELCYDVFGIFNSYQCSNSWLIFDSRNVALSYDMQGCSDCFGCVGLRHKQYHIFNERYSKEEYVEKLKTMNLGSYAAMQKHKRTWRQLCSAFPRKFLTGVQNNKVSGDYLRNSKNVKYSYSGVNCENVAYSQSMLLGVKDSYDYTNWGDNVELTYETQSVGGDAQNVKFSYECFGGVNDIEYSIYCPGSNNLFGCVGLNKKSYCILNKQYSKEEYQALIPKIKQHMMDMPYVDKQGRVYAYGEFFPPEFSPYGANEAAVMDFMEMNKELAQKYGLLWRETSAKEYQITLNATDLPDHINDVRDEITKEVIGCSSCGKGFRIVPTELQFLRRFAIPLPRACFNCRHSARVILRNPYPHRWYASACQCIGPTSKNGAYKNHSQHAHHASGPCPNTFESSYSPDKPDIIYCEQCYQQEVV